MKQPANRFIRLPEVMSKTGLGRASIYRYIDMDRFPKPVKIGDRASAWPEHEIDEWLVARVQSRDKKSAEAR